MSTAADPSELGRFLSLADVAELLDLEVAEVHALVRSGELEGIRVRGSWRIEQAAIERFVEFKHEEARRMRLWRQAQFTDLPELFTRAPRID
ncbi:helix-turn-helix domain-containing protein [Homoserinibacter sp. GY 40078]|uniref:helix-turn-helix domain-containing protein n=1 Tax=Homoserinibacter sp. GY 40078 TaxID=2603275 RepID=UPI0011CAB393|nr:helix-turn-helix domain-containing protein [Homoserinibacter sp. GY 40078]TXK16301.1 helix-turn-helix domain-containing protein [Homoserinibacter sp. GY 40078]